MNVLNLRKGSQVSLTLSDSGRAPKIEGTNICIFDKTFDNSTTTDSIWQQLLQATVTDHYITYIIVATKGHEQLGYVGKTSGSMTTRYPQGPAGNLRKVFDLFNDRGDSLECVIYNTSHPALVELWCHQILQDRKINLANKIDTA